MSRALKLWGEMGLVGRASLVVGLLVACWTLLTAAWGGVTTVLVSRSAFEQYVHDRDTKLATYLYQRDSAQAVKNVRDSAWQAETRRLLKQDCIRHHGTRACLD